MVHKEINFGTSATILVIGDSEQITIELRRGSTVKSRDVINLNPKGIIERIFPSWVPPDGKYDHTKEGKFKARIARCIEVMSDIARIYVQEDMKQEREFLANVKREREKTMEIDQYITTLVPKDANPPKSGDQDEKKS
jgi:hypothetical protein